MWWEKTWWTNVDIYLSTSALSNILIHHWPFSPHPLFSFIISHFYSLTAFSLSLSLSLSLSRSLSQQIMKDRWINAGCDEEDLKPFLEPELDITDQKRIGTTQMPTAALCLYAGGCLSLCLFVCPGRALCQRYEGRWVSGWVRGRYKKTCFWMYIVWEIFSLNADGMLLSIFHWC